jgi:acyl carrier protein
MINFIELFNAIAKIVKPSYAGEIIATKMDDKFSDIGIDSLDTLMMLMYLCEIYDVPEAVAKEWTPQSVQEVYDLLMAHKNREPESVHAAVESVK